MKPRLFTKKLKRPCKPRLYSLHDGKRKKVLRKISLPEDSILCLDEKRRLPTLPHCIAVPSAQAGLTSLFGMGRGGTPPLSPPDMGDMRLRYRHILWKKNISCLPKTEELTVAIQLKVCAEAESSRAISSARL